MEEGDLPFFFEMENDPAALRLAAFTPENPGAPVAFQAHWDKIRANPQVSILAVTVKGRLAGHIASWLLGEELNVSYWIAREFWGSGTASQALMQFSQVVTQRPIHGRAAADNAASRRVLEKCGFVYLAAERTYANGRGEEIEEAVYRLE